jgi:hypothetical protein
MEIYLTKKLRGQHRQATVPFSQEMKGGLGGYASPPFFGDHAANDSIAVKPGAA